MLDLSPLLRRTALCKLFGLAIGLAAFLSIPLVAGQSMPMLQWGLLGWYITFGAFIGLGGFVTRVPLLNLPFPPYIRGGFYGAWLNLIVVLLAHDKLVAMSAGLWGLPAALTSPWWMILDGFVIGLLIDMVATRMVPGIKWPEATVKIA